METAIWQEYRDRGLIVLGVSNEAISTIEQFVADQRMSFPVLRDVGGGVYGQYYIDGGISPFPRDFIIDQNGIIRYMNTEYDVQTMKLIIEGLLQYELGVEDDATTYVPDEYRLEQNYPNPFNPTTTIRYKIPDARIMKQDTGQTTQDYARKSSLASGLLPLVSLKIYNILGQEVKTLVDETKEPGFYTVTWDGRDRFGNEVASGFYFCRLTAGGTSRQSGGVFTATRSMVLVR